MRKAMEIYKCKKEKNVAAARSNGEANAKSKP
jgi:hypothetical protein